MFKLDDNYYHRKCFFKSEPQVPTQTVIKKTMGDPLANIYFKSMSPQLKALAGLEPVMKGGGANWYMPPQEILKSRHVLKPIPKDHLAQLGYVGIDGYAMRMHDEHFKQLEEEKRQALLARDELWKNKIVKDCEMQWKADAQAAAKQNTEKIRLAFNEFSALYATSITKIESLLTDAAAEEIKKCRAAAFQKMQTRYETLLKQQATMLYDRFAKKLEKKKTKLKNDFLYRRSKLNNNTLDRLHDINVEKHVAVEKLRHLLECQNMACQVYVALREREECKKEMEEAERKHEKKVKYLNEQIAMKDFNISLAAAKEKKCQEFDRTWQAKVCHIVKKFKMFVSFCLNTLPEYAEFFLNVEKLMMLQLDGVMEKPSAESIFEAEPETMKTPVPLPHPYYLCCEKGNQPQIDKNLCPVHCTASAEQFPVVIVNKRCIYAACDNFDLFTSKIKDFVDGNRGDDADLEDDHDYTYDVPVRYTSDTHVRALELESSLMQILQTERPNLRGVETACCVCRLPYCFCSPIRQSETRIQISETVKTPSMDLIPSGQKITSRKLELMHEREPKWKSFMRFLWPMCECPRKAKHHMEEHLPAYMRNMSMFDAPDLPNYQPCDLDTVKRLVKKAYDKHCPPRPMTKVASKTKDVGVQFSDPEFDLICTCFSDHELDRLCLEILQTSQAQSEGHFNVVDAGLSDTHLKKEPKDFAAARAFSLRNLLDDTPELHDIFQKPNCSHIGHKNH